MKLRENEAVFMISELPPSIKAIFLSELMSVILWKLFLFIMCGLYLSSLHSIWVPFSVRFEVMPSIIFFKMSSSMVLCFILLYLTFIVMQAKKQKIY